MVCLYPRPRSGGAERQATRTLVGSYQGSELLYHIILHSLAGHEFSVLSTCSSWPLQSIWSWRSMDDRLPFGAQNALDCRGKFLETNLSVLLRLRKPGTGVQQVLECPLQQWQQCFLCVRNVLPYPEKNAQQGKHPDMTREKFVEIDDEFDVGIFLGRGLSKRSARSRKCMPRCGS